MAISKNGWEVKMDLSTLMSEQMSVIDRLLALPEDTDSNTWPELAAVRTAYTDTGWAWWSSLCRYAMNRTNNPVLSAWFGLESVNGGRRVSSRTMTDVYFLSRVLDRLHMDIEALGVEHVRYIRLLELWSYHGGMVYEDAGKYDRAAEVYVIAADLANRQSKRDQEAINRYHAAHAALRHAMMTNPATVNPALFEQFSYTASELRRSFDSITPEARRWACTTHCQQALLYHLSGSGGGLHAMFALAPYAFMDDREKPAVEDSAMVARAIWEERERGEQKSTPFTERVRVELAPLLAKDQADPYWKIAAEVIAAEVLEEEGKQDEYLAALKSIVDRPARPGTVFVRTLVEKAYHTLTK